MYVTELIKYKEFKSYLVERFPKPALSFRTGLKLNNENPSLTGHAFEILFSLACIKKTSLNTHFSDDYLRAGKNIASLRKSEKIGIYIRKSNLLIGLTDKDYKSKVPLIKTILKETTWMKKENNKILKSIRVSKDIICSLPLIFEIIKKTGLVLLYPSQQMDTIIYNQESIANFYEKVILNFKKQSLAFVEDKILTKQFTKTLLFFTEVSSPFFSKGTLLNSTTLKNAYLNQTFKHFKFFCKSFTGLNGKVIKKPSLRCYGILATPDFIIKDKIIEVKTSQKFSSRDYLQALTYLIFAQNPEHIAVYGPIRSAIIYYSRFNKQIEIKISELSFDAASYRVVERITKKFKKTYFDLQFKRFASK